MYAELHIIGNTCSDGYIFVWFESGNVETMEQFRVNTMGLV